MSYDPASSSVRNSEETSLGVLLSAVSCSAYIRDLLTTTRRISSLQATNMADAPQRPQARVVEAQAAIPAVPNKPPPEPGAEVANQQPQV